MFILDFRLAVGEDEVTVHVLFCAVDIVDVYQKHDVSSVVIHRVGDCGFLVHACSFVLDMTVFVPLGEFLRNEEHVFALVLECEQVGECVGLGYVFKHKVVADTVAVVVSMVIKTSHTWFVIGIAVIACTAACCLIAFTFASGVVSFIV